MWDAKLCATVAVLPAGWHGGGVPAEAVQAVTAGGIRAGLLVCKSDVNTGLS